MIKDLNIKESLLKKVTEGYDFDGAIKQVFNLGVGMKVVDRNTLHALAERYAKAGRVDQSLRCWERIVEQWPNDSGGAQNCIRAIESGIATIDGNKLKLNHPAISDFMKFRLAGGKYEVFERRILKTTLKDTDRVLELGSGIGLIGIVCKNLKPAVEFSGCEANPRLLELIKENQKLNNCEFEVDNAIYSDFEGETDFYVCRDFWASTTIVQKFYEEKLSIPVRDINKIIKDQNKNYLIMDIEGGEMDLIPKIDFSPIDKVMLEVHPERVGDRGVSEVFKWLLADGFCYDVWSSWKNVVFFRKS